MEETVPANFRSCAWPFECIWELVDDDDMGRGVEVRDNGNFESERDGIDGTCGEGDQFHIRYFRGSMKRT